MFERRLRWLLGLFVAALVVLVFRLGHLQVLYGAHYSRLAQRSLLLRPVPLPAVRGRILDRTGQVLVRDEPSWQVAVDFDVLVADVKGDGAALRRVLKRRSRVLGLSAGDASGEQVFHQWMTQMWRQLASVAVAGSEPTSEYVLRSRAERICDRVARIHKMVTKRRGFDTRVKEETQAHALLTGLGEHDQIAVREALADFPWVKIQPASIRQAVGGGTPFAHVLGRLGRVDAAAIADDPNSEDPFTRYLADERRGVSGVEWTAESTLRGRRGEIAKDRNGDLVNFIAAENGSDVGLTIHADLQRRLYRLLGQAVENVPESSGGAIVVLDVATREVLALVSYPSYDPMVFNTQYASLAKDTRRMPLRFRAVSSGYPPGSTIKPLVCLAGLINGQISLDSTMTCSGYLFPEQRDRWRCWQIHGTAQRKAHGDIDVVQALTGSCNVFMYRLGEGMGVDRLCSAFHMVHIGLPTGIGLKEEFKGVNPTPGWLNLHKNTPTYPSHARLFAIGQGEITMTPVQVANLMATYASGRFRPIQLIQSKEPTPQWELPVTVDQLRAVQRGIYGVVNDSTGTAYHDARLVHHRYALCGKTGSATAHRWPTSYRVAYADDQGATQVAQVWAGSKSTALDRFKADHPDAVFEPEQVEIATRWPPYPPPTGERFSHAWFGGYLQELDDLGEPVWDVEPKIAFAVLVEFGGSGGRVGGPVAKQIATTLLEVLGEDLTADRKQIEGPSS